MARTTPVTLPYQTVVAVSETAVFVPSTGWMPAGRVQRLRPTRELAGRTNVLEAAVAYQTADVVDSPNASQAVGTYMTHSGVAFPSQFADISANTEAAQLIRFGFMVRNASGGGTSLSTGVVGANIELELCGG